MAPTKKREKDNVDCVGGLNGLNSGHGVDTTTNEALTVSTAASAAAAALATTTTSTIAQETNAKLNGHQQEQELFLQAFESKCNIIQCIIISNIYNILINYLLQSPHKSTVTYAIATRQM